MKPQLKILICDDHHLFIEGLKLVLQYEANISTEDYAHDGNEAINKCKHTVYDLIFMDINMPVIDGIEATREIKRLHPETKIIMVSMLADYGSVVKAMKAGANGYLLKNTDHEELLEALRKVLRGETYISKSLSQILNLSGNNKLNTNEDYIKFAEHLITPREQSILKLIVEGKTDSEISGVLNISDKTVSTHRKNMLAKLGLRNTAQLVKFAMDNGLV